MPRYATPPVVPTPEYVPCVVCGDPAAHPDDSLCWRCFHTHLITQERERRHAEQAAWEASLPERYDTAAEMAEADDA